MLSPNDTSQKATAPSIWSFDSGYSSNSIFEEEGVLSQPTQSHPSLRNHTQRPAGLGIGGFWSAHIRNRTQSERQAPAIEPLVTKLSVFTTTELTDNDFNLPEISAGVDTCMECEFWEITNPGENIKCQNCRLPEIVEPSSLLLDETPLRGIGPLPKLQIPTTCQTKDIDPAVLQTMGSSSFSSSSHSITASKSRTISRCSACELSALVNPTGPKHCASCSLDPSFLSPISEASPQYKVRRSRAGRNSKLPLQALNRLQAWLEANQHDPYPDSDTKRLLAQECGITEKQVTTWFTNARARQLSPLDAYLSSSSEEEAANQGDIASAAEAPTYSTGGFNYISDEIPQGHHHHRPASISDASAFSNAQSRARISRRGKKKIYRRNQESPQTPMLLSPTSITSPLEAQNDQEMWNCTFCRKSLVPKSWRRHEETQHRPKAEWTCMLYGPRLTVPTRSNSSSVCAFCMMKNPPEDHFLNHHRIEDCAKRDIIDRTFYRPDHLRQHIKNFHNASLFEYVQARWKRAADAGSEGWTCGFCAEKLETWDKRETHIANHFKDGMTITSWTDYPETDKAAGKQSRTREKDDVSPYAAGRFSRITRRSTRSSQPAHTHAQPQPQPQPQPQRSPFDFDSLPTSLGFGMSQPQAPILPDIPPLNPITLDDFSLDWNIPTSLGQDMSYTLPNSNVYNPSLETTSLQQFDSSLNMDLYENPIDYHGPWGQGQQQ